MTESIDVLVIGAGPAGLLATDRLVTQRVDVLLVDAGRSHTKRICPVDKMRSCYGCKSICNVISGFGGSIHYGDGVKLSRFPSGRRLAELLGTQRAEHLCDEALTALCGDDLPHFQGVSSDSTPFLVKDYPVASLSSQQVRAVIDRLFVRLSTHPRVTLQLGTSVSSLQPQSDHTWVATLSSPSAPDRKVKARAVIASVGRRGRRWWHEQIRYLGLAYTPPAPSVGVRFECPSALLKGGSDIHADFKTTLVRQGVKIKTFCFCAGPGGGRIKFTDYGDYTLLDGHVIPELGNGTSANFALLAQLRDEDGEPRDVAWVEQHLLIPYRALRTDRPGKPVLQWYPDFRECVLRCTDLDKFTSISGVIPSLRDYQMANLACILPAPVHSAFIESFEELMQFFIRGPLDAHLSAQIGVIGLELENIWDELKLTSGLETTAPGLYAAGDCTGLAQGILQAAAGGLAAADQVLATANAFNKGA